MTRPLLAAALLLSLAAAALAEDAVLGTETLFSSPNGTAERCIRIAPMPGAAYSADDLGTEQAFCAIDLYAPTVALCPKTWSTSPGMIIRPLPSITSSAGPS